MLASVLQPYQAQIAALADAWLMSGASTFSLWQNDQPSILWPAGADPDGPGVTAQILVGGNLWGELRVTGCGDHPAAQTRLTAEASLISRFIALEFELDSMTAELVDSQDQLLTLYHLAQSTRSRLNLVEMLASLSQEIKQSINAEGVFIMIGLPQQPLMVEQHPRSLLPDATLQWLFERVQVTRQELLLPAEDIAGLPRGVTSLFLELTPVRADVVALIGVLFTQPLTSLSPRLKLVRAIAEQAGAQMENALLHREILQQARLKTELELAAQIQLQLLPRKPPVVAGLTIAARSRPALQVGGDFYDFIAPQDRPFTFIIGDVSGKGMPAALLMAMTHTVIRSKANLLPTPTPEAVLSYANAIMYDDFTEVGMFATVFVGRYSPAQAELIYANTGHSPVIYCPTGGSARLLEADGPALGVLPQSLSENCTINFQPGDLLIVATDGFNEARAAGQMFGYDRLLRLVESLAEKPAQEISDIVFQTIDHFSGHHPQGDDQTLVVIKRLKP